MIPPVIRLLRPSHWLKNGVVLAPLIFAGRATDITLIESAAAAVAVFCLLSSAVYVLNDLLDRKTDRLHPLKKSRPLASGDVPVGGAIAMLAILAATSLGGAWAIGTPFLTAAVVYLVLNLAYSAYLKRVVLLDAMSVALGFCVRAYAGALAIGVPCSKWLLINTLFLALFMALGKRRHELILLSDEANNHRRTLGLYSAHLLDQLIGITTAAVVIAYMLYTFSNEVSVKLGTETLFFTVPFVVYGVFRYLYLIHRKDMGGSPTAILLTDKPILATVCLWATTVIVILYVA